MRPNTLALDVALAVAVAIVVLIVSPGLAVTAILAIFVLLVGGISLVFEIARAGSRNVRPPRPRRRGQ